jgi:hypothetical protein
VPIKSNLFCSEERSVDSGWNGWTALGFEHVGCISSSKTWISIFLFSFLYGGYFFSRKEKTKKGIKFKKLWK